mgnify:FL=1
MQKFSMDYCQKSVEASSIFETNNTDLKRLYILENIKKFNNMAKYVSNYNGTFGTGYPFYALDSDLKGKLPIIEEQLRYNKELLEKIKESNKIIWLCGKCLEEQGETLPDLKQICKPCPRIDNELKPRKIINRLPDIDMWIVSEKKNVEQTKEEMTKLFDSFDLYPSDINPIRTMQDIIDISENIVQGTMPDKNLPLDAHIIDKETLIDLIENVPKTLKESVSENTPYLPIHPQSYRKKWQYDDEAYNFIYDYLSAFTPFNCDIMEMLVDSRKKVSSDFTNDELFKFLYSSATDANKRRFESKSLKKIFNERMETWRKK